MPPVGQFEGLGAQVANLAGSGIQKAAEALAALGRAVGALADGAARGLAPVQKLGELLAKALADGAARVLAPVQKLGELLAKALAPVGRLALDAADAISRPLRALVGALADGAARGLAPVQKLGELLAKALAPVGRLALDAADAISRPLRALAGAVGGYLAPIGKAFQAALGPVASYVGRVLGGIVQATVTLTGAFGAFTAAVAGVVGAIAGIGQAMLGFVQKASPAAVMQFNLALDDLMAVLGQALAPVLQVVTKLLRTVADALTAVVPAGAMLAEALTPLADLLGNVLSGAIWFIAQVVKGAMPYLVAFAQTLADVVRWAAQSVRELLSLIGIEFSDAQPGAKGSSVGAAVRGASIGSVESVIQKAQVSAFSLGTAAGPAERSAGYLDELRKEVAQIRAIINDIPNMPRKFAEALQAYGTKMVEGVTEGLTHVSTRVREGTTGFLRGVFVDPAIDALRRLSPF